MRQILTKRVGKALVTVIGLGLIGSLVMVIGSRGARANPGVAPPAPLTVATRALVTEEGFTVRQRYTGQVEGRRRSALAFERGARLIEILADEGEEVAAGAPLARLDVRDLDLGLAAIDARLAEARAVLAELEKGPREEVILAARADLAAARAELGLAQVREERRKALVGTQALAAEEYESARFGREALQARVRALEARLLELERGTREERVLAQRARLAGLEAERGRIELDRQKSTILAPFAGRVATRHLDEGTVVTPGAPVLTLVESGRLEARIGIPNLIDASWEVDQEVVLSMGREELSGRFLRFEAELERATRSRVAIFALAEGAPAVPGTIVRVEKPRVVAQRGFWMPRTALTRNVRGLWACFVVEPDGNGGAIDVVHRRAIEILHEDDDRVFVRGTLSDGERVIVDGGRRVVDGQTVLAREVGR